MLFTNAIHNPGLLSPREGVAGSIPAEGTNEARDDSTSFSSTDENEQPPAAVATPGTNLTHEPGGQEVEVLLCQEMDHARAQSHDTTTAESPASRARTTLRAGGLPGTQRRPDVPCISDNTPSAGSRRRVGFRIRCMRRLAQSSPRPGG